MAELKEVALKSVNVDHSTVILKGTGQRGHDLMISRNRKY